VNYITGKVIRYYKNIVIKIFYWPAKTKGCQPRDTNIPGVSRIAPKLNIEKSIARAFYLPIRVVSFLKIYNNGKIRTFKS
jgi:hypothetical protein